MKTFTNLYSEITATHNLFWAWKVFRRGKTKKKDVLRFEWQLEQHIFAPTSQNIRQPLRTFLGPLIIYSQKATRIRFFTHYFAGPRGFEHYMFSTGCRYFSPGIPKISD